MNFYKHHLGDYDGATVHLTWDEDMAYTRLLRAYYRREKPITQEEAYRLSRASTAAQRKAVDSVLKEFFENQTDGWHNKRADEEIAAYQHQASTNRRIARQRFVNEPTNESSNDSLTKGQPNHKPLTTNHKPEKEKARLAPVALPAWIPQEPWKAWLETRSKKKIPNTDAALKLAVGELKKLREQGHDPAAVLEQATLKGWRGLFPLTVATTQPQAAGARPSIVCVTCNQRAFTWTGDRCDPCWRKSQGLAA